MEGRYCVVTGASSGIGLATARALARRGARLRITGRSPERLERAEASLRDDGADVVAFRVDFSSLADVRRFSRELLIRGEPIHVLIHNAGVWHRSFERSADGYEDTFAVNHLAPFLLTHRLLDRMLATGDEARVVHVSSRLHSQAGNTSGPLARAVHLANVLGIPLRPPPARLDVTRLHDPPSFEGLEAYASSKLAQLLFSNELARRLTGTTATSNAVHPGSVRTKVVRDSPLLAALSERFGHLVLKTPEQGAATSVFVATDPGLRGVSGAYFADSRRAEPSPTALDESLAARLWERSAELVGLRLDETPKQLR